VEYAFTHALTHEVAYGSLPQARRRAGRIGTMETLHRDRLGEHVERLAHHALKGAAGEGVPYLAPGRRQGGRAVGPGRLVWFEQALGVLRHCRRVGSRWSRV
jgi:hypothetical protein